MTFYDLGLPLGNVIWCPSDKQVHEFYEILYFETLLEASFCMNRVRLDYLEYPKVVR